MATSRRTTGRHRPKLFVGSSVEGLDVAYAIQENLERDAEVTVWPQGVFELTKSSLSSLVAQLARSDFGVFVFTPDDRVRLRGKTKTAVRDNVLFELGLFTGRLGPARVFVVMPRQGTEDMRIPTDLIGALPGAYDSKREDGNVQAALGPFCNQVRTIIRRRAPGPKARARTRSARASRPRVRGLVIHSAHYGAGTTWVDVRAPLRAALERAGLVRVDNALAGDPVPNVSKVLQLEFTFSGERRKVDVPEGGTLSFPRPE